MEEGYTRAWVLDRARGGHVSIGTEKSSSRPGRKSTRSAIFSSMAFMRSLTASRSLLLRHHTAMQAP